MAANRRRRFRLNDSLFMWNELNRKSDRGVSFREKNSKHERRCGPDWNEDILSVLTVYVSIGFDVI